MIGSAMLQRIADCVERNDLAEVGIPDLLSSIILVLKVQAPTCEYQADKGGFMPESLA